MRIILFVFVVSVSSVAGADIDSGRFVFEQECKQIDPKTTGISCEGFKKGGDGPWFTFREAARNLPDGSRYQFERLIQRYFDIGGNYFYIRRADRPKKEYSVCYRKGRSGWGCKKFCGPDYLESVKECK